MRDRRTLILAVGLLVLLTVVGFRTEGLLGNELETFVYTKHWIDPTFIPNDWRLDQPPGPRLPFMVLVAPLVQTLSIEHAAIVGQLLGFMLVSIAAALFLVQIGLSLLEGLAVVAAYLALGQDLAAAEWLVGPLESKVVAYAFVLVALARASTQLVVAGAALGFATTMHILVGGWATLLLAAATCRTGIATSRDRWKAIATWVLFASPGIAVVLLSIEGSAATPRDAVTPEWIYVTFRAPHHLDPGYFLERTAAKVVVGLAVLAALLVTLPRVVRRAVPLLLAGRFFQASVGLFVLGIVLSSIPGGLRFLQVYPFRVGDGLGLLLGLALAAALAKTWLRTPFGRALLLLLVVAAGLAATVRLHQIRHGNLPPTGFDDVARWVKTHTPPSEHILVSPHRTLAGYWMERPVIVQFKFTPHHGERVREWYERLVDLAGGTRPATRGFRASREVHERFRSLPAEAYRSLGLKYRARYLVRTERADLPFSVAYRAEGWAVYDLDGP